jgi:hypothetical protein
MNDKRIIFQENIAQTQTDRKVYYSQSLTKYLLFIIFPNFFCSYNQQCKVLTS